MATTSDRRTANTRSGGKIVRNRRVPMASRTPYVRHQSLPKKAPIEDHENPNWLSGLIYPAKMIASGAGKLLSFFGSDSSSSSSDSEGFFDNEKEEEVENDVSFQGDDRLNKVLLSSSSKSDKKRAIEQLVMQEIFSREEGNELIQLVKSRVVDTNGNFDVNSANIRSAAIMEARKWLQQKRVGCKKKMENEIDATNLATPFQLVTRNEKGSPVDVAKSYMQNRPAWASSALNHAEFGSPSPSGVLHFKEETPKSTFCSSEMNRSSLSSGSWNILEEIRRVRSKASEELLAATPLTKTYLSSLSPENNPPQGSLMVAGTEAPTDSTHDRPQSFLQEASTRLPSRTNQDADGVQSMEPQECRQDADLKSNKDDEMNDLRGMATENGFPSTASRLAAGLDTTPNPRPSEEVNRNPDGSSQAGPDVQMGDPDLNLPDGDLVNGSQNSSSIQPEDLSQELSLPIVERTSSAKVEDSPRGRKSRGRYRGRGRGRGMGRGK